MELRFTTIPYRFDRVHTGAPACWKCGSTGMATVHRQGDPVPGKPGFFYAGTLLVACGCRTVSAAG